MFYSYVNRRGDCISRNIILAEIIIQLFDDSGYPDLLTFEKDLAAISLMIIIFSESPGAIAELGSFSALENIKDRLILVFHEEDVSDKNSFIWKGPVRHLKTMAIDRGNDNPIYVYNWAKENLDDNSFPDVSNLYDSIETIIAKRKTTRIWDRDDVGHIMLLLAASLNIMQIATIEELKRVLQLFDLEVYAKYIGRYLNMLKALNIIGYKQYGNSDYYVAGVDEWLKWSYRISASDFLWNKKFSEFYMINQENKVKAWRSFHTKD